MRYEKSTQLKLSVMRLSSPRLCVERDGCHARLTHGKHVHSSPTAYKSNAKLLSRLQLPPLSTLKTEPMVVSIDRLDIVLAEKVDEDDDEVAPGDPAAASPGKAAASSSSYGLGDKVCVRTRPMMIRILTRVHT